MRVGGDQAVGAEARDGGGLAPCSHHIRIHPPDSPPLPGGRQGYRGEDASKKKSAGPRVK